MTAARVHLRYRPASDVLSGDIELSTIDADGAAAGAHAHATASAAARSVAEAPDADSHLEWQRLEADDTEYLTAFQIVHAGARLEAGTMPALPDALLPIARDLVQSGGRTLASSTTALARLQAKVEVVVHLTAQQLARPAHALLTVPASWSVDRSQVAATAIALRRAAAAIRTLPPVQSTDATVSRPELERTEHLARLLLEVAAVVTHTQGTPAPGATAAARRAVRGGVALAASERAQLKAALAQLDDTTTWPKAVAAINALCDRLEAAGPPR